MDVFDLRQNLISKYQDYVGSFIRIRNSRIERLVDDEIKDGLLWPRPLVQLNPFFERGKSIPELCDEKILSESCRRIFRIGKIANHEGSVLSLHRHQEEAIRIARSAETGSAGDNYVLTTGTGSGKSLSYIIPIVDYCLRVGPRNRRIKAIIIYPMNALANSQMGELEKFLVEGYPEGQQPVSFARYTGQENDEERDRIQNDPPDILLTNYVMMELILTRNEEPRLIRAAQNLRFLVLDELHTYRGRQGADVGMLVRRIREDLNARTAQHIGTSATIAGADTFAEQQVEVAKMATALFGSEVKPQHVIGEYLQRYTLDEDVGSDGFKSRLIQTVQQGLSSGEAASPDLFRRNALAAWVETTLGLANEKGGERKRRATPLPIEGKEGAAELLAGATQLDPRVCAEAIRAILMAGYALRDPSSNLPIFAFRVHQFLSRGDTVYASLGSEESRSLTVHAQQFVPGTDKSHLLFPLEFCRECGQEVYRINANFDKRGKDGKPLAGARCHSVTPRSTDDWDSASANNKGTPGYLLISSDPEVAWPDDPNEIMKRVPEDWLETGDDQQLRIATGRIGWLPRKVVVDPTGLATEDGVPGWFLPKPFRFCPCCGVSYDPRQQSDKAKLGTLGIDRRSTATTILTLTAVRALREQDPTVLANDARKVLSFSDNRQDASLQSGHFNDFVEVGLLRGAVYAAVAKAGEHGLRHDELTQKVYEALNLEFREFAQKPEAKFADRTHTIRALQNLLGYLLYRDLRRGWRIVAPNLEQCGLLGIGYESLTELCAADEDWQTVEVEGQPVTVHTALRTATPEIRERISHALLDYLRRELVLKADYLDPTYQERIRQQSNQYLVPPWAIDEDEARLDVAAYAFPRARVVGRDYEDHVFVSPRGSFANYLCRKGVLSHLPTPPKRTEVAEIMPQLFLILEKAGLLQPVLKPEAGETIAGYQIPASSLIWTAGKGQFALHDPIRMPNIPEGGRPTNDFFVQFYRNEALKMRGIHAREHTAQVPYELREQREHDFAEAKLPVLFCSPTMELGVDIKRLNVVNLRNVPPTPANYAQRSGRAGRSGQPALVFTYCAGGSQHDQWFFRRPHLMVAGSVSTPRLDMANEDLIRAHVHAIWLGETGARLGRSLRDVLEVNGETPTLALLKSIATDFEKLHAKEHARVKARSVLASVPDLADSGWWFDGWIDMVLHQVSPELEKACERWRSLFRSAQSQMLKQNKVRMDASASARDKDEARRLYGEAESQLKLLTDARNAVQSDFYSYRYFASEAFLPGYSFPRLPLSAYIPGRKRVSGSDEFLSRPRFLGISEFGPRALVYHEGARYRIHKVIMPVREDASSTTLTKAKLCGSCGHLHPATANRIFDKCDHCHRVFDKDDVELANLFRLENVSTRRVDRISSDEEERFRQGFEIKTGLRWAESRGAPVFRVGSTQLADETRFTLTYGHTATVWRINYGLNRREDRDDRGFWLDMERGYWVASPFEKDDGKPTTETTDPTSTKREKVIPYVEDRKNCLMIEITPVPDIKILASLQAALKHAIQVVYQLEDNELAAEPMPDRQERQQLLFYESAEGGAGVLRLLIDDDNAFQEVAKKALEICHFDAKGNDLKRAPRAREDCVAACYDCLLSYTNQFDHASIDRHAIRDLLLRLTQATVKRSSINESPEDQYARLRVACESGLEREWLEFIETNRFRLPTHAQRRDPLVGSRPDFTYDLPGSHVAIYVDGPVHDFPERAARDVVIRDRMEDEGWLVVRFHHAEEWLQVAQSYPSVFGSPSCGTGASGKESVT
jgi:very-short-patch-repair endonuclease